MPGSSVAVDPTADSAYGSEVFVIADESAFLNMAQTEFSGHLIGLIIVHVDDMKPGEKGLSLRQDQTEFVSNSLRVCQYAASPSPTRGSSACDQSVAKETISAPGVQSQARYTNFTVLEGSVGN